MINGQKKLYLNLNGKIDFDKFKQYLKDIFFNEKNSEIETFLLETQKEIEKFQFKRNGDLFFDNSLFARKKQLSALKPFRAGRASTKSKGGIYNNAHGICAGLSHEFLLSKKNKTTDDFFRRLRNAKEYERDRKIAHDKNLGAAYRFQNNPAIISDTQFYGKICPGVETLSSHLLSTFESQKQRKSFLHHGFISTPWHRFCFCMEKEKGSDNVKITIYEPNTKEIPVVKYLSCDKKYEASEFKDFLLKAGVENNLEKVYLVREFSFGHFGIKSLNDQDFKQDFPILRRHILADTYSSENVLDMAFLFNNQFKENERNRFFKDPAIFKKVLWNAFKAFEKIKISECSEKKFTRRKVWMTKLLESLYDFNQELFLEKLDEYSETHEFQQNTYLISMLQELRRRIPAIQMRLPHSR